MFEVKSNLAINGLHWGLKFTAGVAHTESAALADKLRLKGYVVTDETLPAEETPEESNEEETFVCSMCGKEYKSKQGLDKHMAGKHPEVV